MSILDVSEGLIEVVSTNGDTHLGGDDWDLAVVDWVTSEFLRDQGIDLKQDRQALQLSLIHIFIAHRRLYV